MLGHHINTSEANTTLLARVFPTFRNIIPDWFVLEIIIHFSDHNPLDKIPRDVEKIISQLVQLFYGGKLTGDAPRIQQTFAFFLRESFPVLPLSIKINLPEVHCLHVTTCLEIMAKELQFNSCEFPSSLLRNNDVLNLGALSEANMSSPLRYACRHWTDQISSLETLDADLLQMLDWFFNIHFLHWLEVMSILALSPADALKNLNTVHVCDSMIFATMT